MKRACFISASEEKDLEGGRGLLACDSAGSTKAADGNGEPSASRRKRKGRLRSWATGMTAPVIPEKVLHVKGVEHAHVKLECYWGVT